MTLYYNRICTRCGTPLNTNFPDIHKCDACRIIEATEKASSAEKLQPYYGPIVDFSDHDFTWENRINFIKLIFFGGILLWIMWPFLSMFYGVFFG